MRHDRPAKRPCVIVETPVGLAYDMDVWLTAEEIAVMTDGQCLPAANRVYEPWLRIECGADVVTFAGIEVVTDGDGA